jgi:hypothetical protein
MFHSYLLMKGERHGNQASTTVKMSKVVIELLFSATTKRVGLGLWGFLFLTQLGRRVDIRSRFRL